MNLPVTLRHFGASSCHSSCRIAWPQNTGRIYRKVIIMGSLLEKLVVQLVPRQRWQMAEARHCSTGLRLGITHCQVLDKTLVSDYQGLWFIA